MTSSAPQRSLEREIRVEQGASYGAMGSITPYETAKGRRYMVQFRKPDRTSTTKRGFRTKREAELFLASTEVRKAIGEWIDASASHHDRRAGG